MKEQKLYTIGEVSKICRISTKALRYYDKIGVIVPDYISEENGYRYYTKQTLLAVPVMKYYKQMGFKLEEMQELLEGSTYQCVQQNFHKKIHELQTQEREIHDSLIAIKDWHSLVQEAQLVLRHRIHDISVKFIEETSYCYMDFEFQHDYMESVINIQWTNYLEEMEQRITGPVILHFPSFERKCNGTCGKARIMQKAIHSDHKNKILMKEGGRMAACVYHIGTHDTINKEYERIKEWARLNGYHCEKQSYERYVIDYWTTRNPDEFVTEIIVPLIPEEIKK